MTQTNFTPFCLSMQIGTPIQTSPYPITLDGLLYYTIERTHNFDRVDDILSRLKEVLDFDRGVFKASHILYGNSNFQRITAGTAVHPTCTKWGDSNFTLHKRKVITTKTGGFRARVSKHQTISVGEVRFYGVGDIDAIDFYVSSILGLGRNSMQGHGEITAWDISPIDVDQSWAGDVSGDKRLHRHLPTHIANEFADYLDCSDSEHRNICPPYHLNNPDGQQVCLQPESILIYQA